jgi:cell division septation protein DedD
MALNLRTIVYDLLWEHECVVVPDFGAFIVNPRSAIVEENQNLILPPSNEISFNPAVKKNDALLVNFVADQLNWDYSKAKEEVLKAASAWERKLSLERFLELEGVGTFRKTDDGRLIFQQANEENFSHASYGLQPLRLKPLQQEGILRRLEEPVKKHPNLSGGVLSKMKYVAAAALFIPIIFVASWITFSGEGMNDKFVGLDFNFFSNQTEVKDDSVAEKLSPDVSTIKDESFKAFFTEEEQKLIEEKIISDKETEFESIPEKTSIEVAPEVQAAVQKKKVEEIKTIKPKTVKASATAFKFAIVAGCFRSIENAQDFQKELEQKGYDAQIIGKTSGGLHRVAFSTHNNEIVALKEMAQIRLKDSAQAWLLRQ